MVIFILQYIWRTLKSRKILSFFSSSQFFMLSLMHPILLNFFLLHRLLVQNFVPSLIVLLVKGILSLLQINCQFVLIVLELHFTLALLICLANPLGPTDTAQRVIWCQWTLLLVSSIFEEATLKIWGTMEQL
jgi:hypothetical protein